MKTASIALIKKELQYLSAEKLTELCLRLAKYKKENKEVLDYMLFQADDEQEYIKQIKEETSLHFQEINLSNVFFVKKSVRKILKTVNKYCKYSPHTSTTVELLLHFCQEMNNSGIKYKQNPTLLNLYQNQLKKIQKEINKLHEDLQFDYTNELKKL